MEKLAEWYAGRDSSLCMVSHYYEELEQLADKLLILDEGKVIDYGGTDFRLHCAVQIRPFVSILVFFS